MIKQYVVSHSLYIDITINAESEDQARDIAEDTLRLLELKSDPDGKAIAISGVNFYDIAATE